MSSEGPWIPPTWASNRTATQVVESNQYLHATSLLPLGWVRTVNMQFGKNDKQWSHLAAVCVCPCAPEFGSQLPLVLQRGTCSILQSCQITR